MTGVSASLDLIAYAQGKTIFYAQYTGRITGANGDYLDFISWSEIDATDNSHSTIIGTFKLTGGSGKFANASGNGVLYGVLPCWNLVGELECPK